MPKAILANLGQRLRAARQARGLRLRDLAEASGLSERFLGALERGDANVSLGRLAELTGALGLDLASLLGGTPASAASDAPWDGERGARLATIARAAPLLGDRLLDGLADGLRRAQREVAQRSRLVALLGIRGAGKSSVGPLLAEKLGVRFVELDGLVEREAGLALSEIFALHGEAYYHRLTSAVLEPLTARAEAAVIATGGSIIQDGGLWSLLADRTLSVWLQATAREHWQRVLEQGDTRPMRQDPRAFEQLEALLFTRSPLYARADLCVSTTGRPPAAIAQGLAELIEEARKAGSEITR